MNPTAVSRPRLHTIIGGIVVFGVLGCGGQTLDPGASLDPTGLSIVVGDAQNQIPSLELFTPLIVGLVDDAGREVPRRGLGVTWTVIEGDGTVEGDSDVTTPLGRATAKWTIGSDPGVNRVRVTVDGVGSIDFTATGVIPGPIVFVSGRTGLGGNEFEGYPGGLFLMNEDGSGVLPLFSPDHVSQLIENPRWAPDHRSVLYVRALGRLVGGVPGPEPQGVFEITLDQLRVRRLPAVGAPQYVVHYFDPIWSNDGSNIVVYFDPVPGTTNVPPSLQPRQLARVDAAGLNPATIPAPTPVARSADWTEVGNRLVYVCADALRQDICAMDDDGGSVDFLTSSDWPDDDPVWSPDGAEILFVRHDSTDPGVWLMEADGANPRQIMAGWATSPSWAPDGTRFVVTLQTGERFDIYLVDLSSGHSTNLTNSPYRDREASWRR